jgi:xylulose-5-phosphate/fructose-6-phosphate phosphoketolase
MQRFFKQFSFPCGIGSHASPETPGSIHEGGERQVRVTVCVPL